MTVTAETAAAVIVVVVMVSSMETIRVAHNLL